VGSATCQEGGKGRAKSLPFLCLEQPVGIGQNPEGHSLLAFLVGVLGDVEVAVHQELTTLPDVLTGLGEFAKDPDREKGCLLLGSADGNCEVGISNLALRGPIESHSQDLERALEGL
jgi:hypothetical protein